MNGSSADRVRLRASDAAGPPAHGPRPPANRLPGESPVEPWWRPEAVPARADRHRFSSPRVMAGQDVTSAVDSHHLRAARVLLGWAMSDLAQVSGLSLSTIRRLEQNAHAVSVRNHRSVVDALRTGGIRFLPLDDGTIALGELGHAGVPSRMIAADD